MSPPTALTVTIEVLQCMEKGEVEGGWGDLRGDEGGGRDEG